MRKSLVVGMATMAAIALTSTVSFSAVFETLSVKRATTKPNGTCALMLETTQGSGSYAWYTAPSGSDDQALAVALTAISLGKQVRVGKDNASSRTILEIGLDNN